MSTATALALLERIEHDAELTIVLGAVTHDPDAVLARVRAEGFDVTQADIRAAVIERYGAQLATE